MATRWWVEMHGVQLADGTVQAAYISLNDVDDIAAHLAGTAAKLLGVDPIGCCRLKRGNGSKVYGIVERTRPLDDGQAWRRGLVL